MRYIVTTGDTLESIAARYCGSVAHWRTLWEINRNNIKSGKAEELTAGDILTIPDQLQEELRSTTPAASPNEVYLYVNGFRYSGWSEVHISRSLDAVAGAFSLSMTEREDNAAGMFLFEDGDNVRVTIGDDTVITGYIDSIELSVDNSSHSVSISGRDKTCDLVDCSAVNRPGQFTNTSFLSIAQALCSPYGITVKNDINLGNNVKLFRIQPGESVFDALDRLARGRGLLVSGSAEGNVILTQSGTHHMGVSLVEGQNILSCTFTRNMAERFSHYVVEGQSSDSGGQAHQHSVRATASDESIKRFRQLNVMAEDSATQSYAKERAIWEAKTRAAKAQSASISVPGWRTNDGNLWAINRLISVECPSCHLHGTYLISDIEFTKNDNDGTTTALTLKVEDAFLNEPPEPGQEMGK